MLLYLDVAYKTAVKEGRMRTRKDLADAVYHGAVSRVRPPEGHCRPPVIDVVYEK